MSGLRNLPILRSFKKVDETENLAWVVMSLPIFREFIKIKVRGIPAWEISSRVIHQPFRKVKDKLQRAGLNYYAMPTFQARFTISVKLSISGTVG
jgi:hypothetical protein